MQFGFSAEEWQRLADALFKHAQENDVIQQEITKYGVRYAIDGPLEAPAGQLLNIRSAWFIDAGTEIPRFVTAHPSPRT